MANPKVVSIDSSRKYRPAPITPDLVEIDKYARYLESLDLPGGNGEQWDAIDDLIVARFGLDVTQ